MSGAWSAAALLLAGFGLLAGGLCLPLPPGVAWASWAMIVIGGVALVLGATQVQMMIGALFERWSRARPLTDTDKNG